MNSDQPQHAPSSDAEAAVASPMKQSRKSPTSQRLVIVAVVLVAIGAAVGVATAFALNKGNGEEQGHAQELVQIGRNQLLGPCANDPEWKLWIRDGKGGMKITNKGCIQIAEDAERLCDKSGVVKDSKGKNIVKSARDACPLVCDNCSLQTGDVSNANANVPDTLPEQVATEATEKVATDADSNANVADTLEGPNPPTIPDTLSEQVTTDGPKLKRPNVLNLIVDDLNMWIGYSGKKLQKNHKTPNFDRLSALGLSFTNAHAASTICNPSRAATWSGIRPHVSGCYSNNDEPWTRFIAEGLNMNAHFKDSGYYAAARGKTFHSSKSGFYRWEERKTVYPSEWHEYPNVEKKFKPIPNYYSGFTEDFASADIYKDEDDQDWGTANFCIDQLGSMKERRDADGVPTFLACGLIKPHLPWAVPQKYYDLYPLDEIEMDWLNDWDLDDIPKEGIRLARPHKEDVNVTKLGREKAAVQGYLASIAYADMNLGRILDAYEAMPQSERDNTIVVLWSDHGYHHGQKKAWKKKTLWEEATEVPYIWIVPGMTQPGAVSHRPVDLMSMYPTLCKLAGIDVPNHVDGLDIRKLLQFPDSSWDNLALSTIEYGNHAVVSDRYRYIRYYDGTEEFYDHDNDPNEYNNLAEETQVGGQYYEIKQEMAVWIPPGDMGAWSMDQTCNDAYYDGAGGDEFVIRCPDGSFKARDPNNECQFLEC